jgi:hypothetical protein
MQEDKVGMRHKMGLAPAVYLLKDHCSACIFCLTVIVFPNIISSQPEERVYDPWLDTNDDGRTTADAILMAALNFGLG